jgi:nucleoside phosphorylase
LAEYSITIHHAFYGEVNRAHSCINQTITDPDLTSFLITFTDRPAALPPGVNLMPYLSGSAFLKYYIFTKTFPDQTATRAGMVFTHVLILNQSDINSIQNLQDVFSHFVASTENKNDELKETLIECSKTSPFSGGINQPKYIQQTISDFINTVSPILFSGEIETFRNALQQIWNSPNKDARKKIKFRASFTPSDIVNISDLTIVIIQKDFLSKWQGQSIIYGEHQDIVEITSHSEALFLGFKEANPFHNFLVELNVNLSEVQNYNQYEKVYANFISIGKIDDANILRQDIRVLSKISPTPTDGKTIKEKFIERLSMLIKNKKDTNIKALRNIDWSGYLDGKRKGKQIVSEFIESEIENPNLNPNQFENLLDIIAISAVDEEKNWWHDSIKEAIVTTFKNQSEISVRNIWKLADLSEVRLIYIFSILSSVKDCDNILQRYFPEKLRPETCNALAKIALKKNWYLFHADILLKHLLIDVALEKQIDVERNLLLDDSVGVKYIASKLTSEKLIECALKNCNSKLIELSGEAIIKNNSLLKGINLLVEGWLDIWTSVVLSTNEIFNGLHGREQEIVFSLLDLITKGKRVNAFLFGLIAEKNYSDISEYKNRSEIWRVFPPLHKEKFLNATTQNVIKNLLSGKIDVTSIESEISDRITSDAFMTIFLSENRSNIEPVLYIYSSFNNLKDDFLATYVINFPSTVTEVQAKKLGNLIAKYKFLKSARSVYDKAKYINSFNPAYENCKELVTVNWWESFNIFGNSTNERVKDKPQVFPTFNKEQLMRNELPTVVILTAIKEEYLAVRQHIKEVVEVKQNDTHYEAGIFEFNGKEIAKIIIRECGAKNTTSAIETERAINYFKPNAMFFVGIAGSRKPKDFGIGDVIFPEAILSYEGGKSEKESFLARPDIGVLTYAVLETAKAERKKEDWKMLIKNSIDPKTVKADIGIIASGEQVVEHFESEVGAILTKHYNHTSAIEMEGFGFAKTINRQGRETSNIMTGIVRGISDIIEQPSKTKKNKETDRRPANAKQIASDTAAAFAFWLILKTYE